MSDTFGAQMPDWFDARSTRLDYIRISNAPESVARDFDRRCRDTLHGDPFPTLSGMWTRNPKIALPDTFPADKETLLCKYNIRRNGEGRKGLDELRLSV